MRNQPVEAFIGMGSNLGEREQTLVQAIQLVADLPETQITGISSLYASAPVGYTAQEDFLNGVLRLFTRLEPLDLLHHLQHIENHLGRVRVIRWGPRTLDLDILLYGPETSDDPELLLPHPRMHERAFVLVPLAELAPDLVLAGIPLAKMIKNVTDQKISLFKQDWFAKL